MINNIRRTKIVATLGPSSSDEKMLRKMVQAGMNCVRLNFSHGTSDEHCKRAELVRKIAKELGVTIGILADLQGPKIRISTFKNGKVLLKKGAKFILDASLEKGKGDENQVGIDYKELYKDVKKNDLLLLDDGRIIFKVKEVKKSKIICNVEVGGKLSDHKGINKKGGGLSAPALTEKDKQDLKTAVKLKVDYIAVSFVRHAKDVIQAKSLIKSAKGNVAVFAKIERCEAVEPKNLDEIISASDGIMVARGDLAVEIGEAQVPGMQKRMIKRARVLNKPVITATQMMESMVHSMVPTRAEVSDVANAVLDNTDAVMLSEESAAGDNPELVIKTMARICVAAEKDPITQVSGHRVECSFERVDESIAMATMYAANHFPIKAVVALTESGSTPLWMSRIRSGIPIFGLSRHANTLGKMTIFRDVHSLYFDVTKAAKDKINHAGIKMMKQKGFIKNGDYIIITRGPKKGIHGGTNSMRIIKVVG